jgi:uridine kinase
MRPELVARIADHLLGQFPGHPLRVAVDGITAAGKTTFARELAVAIQDAGRPAVHLTMDGFHHPRAHRYRQGRDSALGYYQDAYNFAGLAERVLKPLGPGGDRRYRLRLLDLAADAVIDEPPSSAPEELVLVVDGSFLQNAALAGLWDEIVFLDTAFDVARARGSRRDADLFGGEEAARAAFDRRYHAACRLYLAEVDPLAHAGIVVENNDVDRPGPARI